ncbi:MAG TPA: AIM24 family protein [Tepidisphaeraceae bacterium]|nr:AIM24 family protein [Tepidisphaeraceae bacterium]
MMTTSSPSHPGVGQCAWCGAAVSISDLSCPGCGASIGCSTRTTDSGWSELAPIRDMAKLRVGSSTCQIEGLYVPVADFNLAAGDGVYFAHHSVLWKDPPVEVRRMPLAGAFSRMLSGLPIVMAEAQGPGHIAFSRDEAGEMIALPLQPGQAIDVREHLFLAATHSVGYSWFTTGIWFTTSGGKDSKTHYPCGRFMDRFTAGEQPGLLLLHAAGNVFIRTLAEGQTLLIKPTAFVYKDPHVHLSLLVNYPTGASSLYPQRVIWLHLAGPGRVAVQSAYEPMEEGGQSVTSTSGQPTIPRRAW